MKFSELMLTGSTVAKPAPGKFRSNTGDSACALGLAAIGNGCTFGNFDTEPQSTARTGNIETIWPWLLHLADRPCHCFWKPRKMLVRDVVTHLFDHHVFGWKNWSLEKLGQWVDAHEVTDENIKPISFFDFMGWNPAAQRQMDMAQQAMSADVPRGTN